jgi:Zn-dependent protease
MPVETWPVPFLLDPRNLEVDAVVTFCVSLLLAITANAEAQNLVATLLGDKRESKDRFHFNAFLHLDLLGTICYLVGGFGWPWTPPVDRSKFKHPGFHLVLTRFAGPVANLLLACIAGSFVMFMGILDWNPRVFLMVVGVNVTTAIYNLLPLPPLAAGYVVHELVPDSQAGVKWLLLRVGPFAVIALAVLERLGYGFFSHYFDPMIRTVYTYFTSGF